MCLEHRGIGVGARGGVRIGDGDEAEWLPCGNIGPVRTRGKHPFQWIVQAVVRVGVTARPAVDGDGEDILGRVESARPEYTRELLTNASARVDELRRPAARSSNVQRLRQFMHEPRPSVHQGRIELDEICTSLAHSAGVRCRCHTADADDRHGGAKLLAQGSYGSR